MKTEHKKVSVDELKVNVLNPRIHSKHNVNMIKKSIQKCGMVDDIIVDENYEILAGHGRFQAVKELGIKEVGVKIIHGLTESQKKQYLIFSNRTTETSEFDGEMLVSIVDSLLSEDPNYEVSDFSIPELTDIYKEDEIKKISDITEVNKTDDLHIVGIVYAQESEKLEEVIQMIENLKEDGEEIAIYKGKSIPNAK